MMTNTIVALPVTILLLVASAFFVIIEFSMLASRLNRLEETAETSVTSRAALRNLNELTVVLAGAQLGITVCTFALGAVTKPWVHHLFMPLFDALSLPVRVADVIAFIISLFLVTVLHLVIGEMAPKSWAIAHPELAVRTVSVPARIFIGIFRPLLNWINRMANHLVSAAGEEPVDRAAAKGYNAETLGQLVEYSRTVGTLNDDSASQITRVINLEKRTLGEAVAENSEDSQVLPLDATAADVFAAAKKSGNLRYVLTDGDARGAKVIHARELLPVDPHSPARGEAREAIILDQEATLWEALEKMRAAGEQIVAVTDADGRVLGSINWDYILRELWPSVEA